VTENNRRMTNEEKLVEECVSKMKHLPWAPEHADREGFVVLTDHANSGIVKFLIPLIQKDLIKRMIEPSEEMLGIVEVIPTSDGPQIIVTKAWRAMLRTFATQQGIEID